MCCVYHVHCRGWRRAVQDYLISLFALLGRQSRRACLPHQCASQLEDPQHALAVVHVFYFPSVHHLPPPKLLSSLTASYRLVILYLAISLASSAYSNVFSHQYACRKSPARHRQQSSSSSNNQEPLPRATGRSRHQGQVYTLRARCHPLPVLVRWCCKCCIILVHAASWCQ